MSEPASEQTDPTAPLASTTAASFESERSRRPLLEIEGLEVIYRTGSGEIPAVRGVDLTVNAGESVGLAGESGCGKSTLASTILRLQPSNATVRGSIRVGGKDVQTLGWSDLRALRWGEAAMVFQGALHSLNPVQRIGDQIAEPIRLHDTVGRDMIQSRVGELLEQVGLPADRARAFPHQLSGGQRQRVMIAMALACRPDLIVADEPTTALDVMVQAQVLDLLTGLVDELSLGLLMITHDLSVLSSTCSRIAVMYAGRVVEEGPADEVFEHPQHPYSEALSAAFPRIGDSAARYAPAGLPGDPPDPQQLPSGCTFHPRCPVALATCSEYDPPIRQTRPNRPVACVLVGEDGRDRSAAQGS
jgi:peptide/nickel transport system ATP-binding protein